VFRAGSRGTPTVGMGTASTRFLRRITILIGVFGPLPKSFA
jgi:hypothetical protein